MTKGKWDWDSFLALFIIVGGIMGIFIVPLIQQGKVFIGILAVVLLVWWLIKEMNSNDH